MRKLRPARVIGWVLLMTPLLTAASLWIVSHVAQRGVNLEWRDVRASRHTYGLSSAEGCAALLLYHIHDTAAATRPVAGSAGDASRFHWSVTHFPARPGSWPVPAPQRFWHWLGFRHFHSEHSYPSGSGSARLIAVPYRYVVLLAALIPLPRTLRGIRGWRRAKTGRCARCGYDLRASPRRCPECGAAMEATAT